MRYNQRQEGHGEEYDNREVVIYDNATCVRNAQNDLQSQAGGPQTRHCPPVHRKSFRGAILSLGLLCLLMVAAIIYLTIHYFSFTTEKQQLSIFNEQLQTRSNNLSNSHNQAEKEVKQLQDKITDVLADNIRLQDEIKKLRIKTKECPKGWTRFGCSCYFKSSEKNKWSESRSNCQEKGSDLVMINSREEQEFLADLNKNEESWIGLRTTENKQTSTGFQWEWVDESPLTEPFWATAELGNPTSWFAASCCDRQGKWTRGRYHDNPDSPSKTWIFSEGPKTPVPSKFLRGAAVFLGVLCLLMVVGIIIVILTVQYVLVKAEKQQLQTRFNNLSNSYNQSQNEVKQLRDKITDALNNASRLQDEISKTKDKTKECRNGWTRFGCSCYFKSSEKKKWSESRSNCQERGSDLVMINSKEEQEFLADLNKNEESWIGLRTTENKQTSTGFQWEWVDESPLTEPFWATAELGNPTGWFVASCCDRQGKWTRGRYNTNPDSPSKTWICEK
ncbi:hypothetical protein Q5P01_018831 [Channa striata]|uniref:C-type lectin domain-containing protein n=1 Tax=Channa striata TaxID=64152 RepID=A0AA88S8U7_CHASR|nr:hypothetical protein Q5P01_018831 [Channa striata]